MSDERLAQAARCTCGKRVVRGDDGADEFVVVDPFEVDAAAELLAWAADRPSFYLVFQPRPRGLVITRRTKAQIKRWPAGSTSKRVVLAHVCALTRREDA